MIGCLPHRLDEDLATAARAAGCFTDRVALEYHRCRVSAGRLAASSDQGRRGRRSRTVVSTWASPFAGLAALQVPPQILASFPAEYPEDPAAYLRGT